MTDQTTAGALSADDQSAIEQAHAIRDGSEWFFEKMIQPFAGGLESTAPQLEPSSTPISDKAFNMIVMFEVSSQAAYQGEIPTSDLAGRRLRRHHRDRLRRRLCLATAARAGLARSNPGCGHPGAAAGYRGQRC